MHLPIDIETVKGFLDPREGLALAEAAAMLANLDRFRDETGAYWMGMQVEQHVFWPVERPAWTAGAVLLAHDAVHEITPACHVLTARDTSL
ncbi:MAG: hypothetical protein EBT71_02850 [Alphaproteobacteria bacterium]|nr:hypothetical protein [Alphaproteobacteria bacterium]